MSRLAAPAIFVLGALLGAGLGYAVIPSVRNRPTTADAAKPVEIPAWSWRDTATPPQLSPAETDAALAALLADRGPYASRADALRAVLARLTDSHLPRVLTALANASDPASHRLLNLAFDYAVERDPAAASHWAASAGENHRWRLSASVRAWSKLDLAAAATWCAALPDSNLVLWLLNPLLPDLARLDPAAALRIANSRDQTFFKNVLPALLKNLAQTDPAAVLLTYGPRLWQDGRGVWQLRPALEAWLKKDPAAALAWVAAQPQPEPGTITPLLHLMHAGYTPADLRRLADAVLTTRLPHKESALTAIVARWASAQPADTLSWINSLPDPALRAHLLEQAASHTHGEAFDKTLPFALTLPDGPFRNERITSLVRNWASTNPEAAIAWLREHPEIGPAALASAHAGLILNLARDEPTLAAAEYKNLNPTRETAFLPYQIADAWAASDPAAALQWFDSVSPAGTPPHEALNAWLAKDPAAALAWTEKRLLADIAQNHADNALIESYFGTVASSGSNPRPRAATADLFAKIQDPALRTQALTYHLSEWLSKDRPAAQKWLESTNALTPAQAAALLSPSH